jgi:hypothetical protein
MDPDFSLKGGMIVRSASSTVRYEDSHRRLTAKWCIAALFLIATPATLAQTSHERPSVEQSGEPARVTDAAVESWFYAIDRGSSDDSSTLYRLGTTAPGGAVSVQRIGETGVEDVFDIAFIGNRLFGIGPGNATFGISDDVLIEINPATGAASAFASIDVSGNLNALVGESAATLIAASSTGEVWRINPDALQATRLGNYGSGLDSSGDLTFVPNGVLFGTAFGFPDRLVRVNTSTGTATVVGSLGFEDVFGLAFHPTTGALLGVADADRAPKLISINPSTGTSTVIGTVAISDEVTGLATAPTPPSPPCNAGSDALFLQNGRFRVDACWRRSNGTSGNAKVAHQQGIGATLWFFNPANPELFLKVVNACSPEFDRFWVFVAGLTNVEVEVRVTDTSTGFSRTYRNPQGQPMAPVIDTTSFDTCP